MSNGTRLLMLARCFPYSHGEVAAESYLETEIGILAKRFDEILAIGTEAPVNSKPTCPLPANVRSLALGVGNSKSDKASEVLQGGVLNLFGPAFVKEAFCSDSAADTSGKRSFLGYFVARAYRKYGMLLKALGEMAFEPTHVYSFWFWDTALVAAWLKAVYPCALVFARAHGYDLYEYRSYQSYLPLREYLLQRLDWLFPCSADGRDYINRMWPGHEEKVRTVYLGTRDMEDRSGAARADIFRVASCSRVVPVKRVDLIADAMKMLDEDGAHVEWTHFGDGEGLQEVKEKVSDLSNVRCEFPGNVPNFQLLDTYGRRDFDLFVNTSESEGLPISLMEACGAGIPVLATNVGGTREIVRPGLDGDFLSEDVTPRRLADSIESFEALSDYDRSFLRKGARHVWRQHFRAASNVSQLADIVLVDRGDNSHE